MSMRFVLSSLLAAALGFGAVPATASSSASITEFNVGTGNFPGQITAGPGPNAALWFSNFFPGGIGRITTTGGVTEFTRGLAAHVQPQGITLGPDGNLWFTGVGSDAFPAPAVGFATPAGLITTILLPNAGSQPGSITKGPDGNLWFTDPGLHEIGRVSPGTHAVTEFGGLTSNAFPEGITAGPDGNVWFTDATLPGIGRITPAGAVIEYPLPAGNNPDAIVTGPDGNLWIANAGNLGCTDCGPNLPPSIDVFNIATAQVTRYNTNPNYAPSAITVGPDGNLWFASSPNSAKGTGEMSRITPKGAVTEYTAGLNAGGRPASVAAGPDGNIWFVDTGCDFCSPVAPAAIGRLTLATDVLGVLTGGSGTVKSAPSGIACTNNAGQCVGTFDDTSIVTLTATPAAGWLFSNWTGLTAANSGCSTAPVCPVTLFGNFDGALAANFTQAPPPPPPPPPYSLLTVTITGSGIVSGTGGLSCAVSCEANILNGTVVTLTATPDAPSTFAGWSGGGCSGTGSCVVTMNAATGVTALFTYTPPPRPLLSVTTTGPSTGTVTSAPAGIDCGATCSAGFSPGTVVALTAAPAAGYSFTGWSGAGCAGTGGCSVTMTAAAGVAANFQVTVPPPVSLTVTTTSVAAGTVTSSPAGIACGVTCSADFPAGSTVTLAAAPGPGFNFAGWSGAGCSGTGGCVVTLSQATQVLAGFTPSTATDITLVAAVLPASRSVQVGSTATVYGTVINASADTPALLCSVQMATGVPASFSYQMTDPATNALAGTPNTPVTVAPGAAQSFVLALTPSAAFAPTQIGFTFACANAPAPAASVVGVNTLLLSASTVPTPDIIALAATPSNDGIIDLPGAGGANAFAIATFDIGAPDQITASANTGGATLPVTLSICQTVPATGQCMAPPAATAPATMVTNGAATFAVFVQGSGTVPFLPAVNRVFVQFQDAGNTIYGATSVAVRTQ